MIIKILILDFLSYNYYRGKYNYGSRKRDLVQNEKNTERYIRRLCVKGESNYVCKNR